MAYEFIQLPDDDVNDGKRKRAISFITYNGEDQVNGVVPQKLIYSEFVVLAGLPAGSAAKPTPLVVSASGELVVRMNNENVQGLVNEDIDWFESIW